MQAQLESFLQLPGIFAEGEFGTLGGQFPDQVLGRLVDMLRVQRDGLFGEQRTHRRGHFAAKGEQAVVTTEHLLDAAAAACPLGPAGDFRSSRRRLQNRLAKARAEGA